MIDPYKTPKAELSTLAEGELNLASRWLRLGGAIIDGLFIGIPVAGIAYSLGLYDSITPQGRMPIGDQLIGFLIGVAIFMIINGYLIYQRGQTVGKVICGTRVVTLDGNQVDGNRYIFRRLAPIWLATQIPIIGGLFSLVDSLLIFRKERNCLHDDIAKTRVIKI